MTETCNSCMQRENYRNLLELLKEKENEFGSTKLALCVRDLICNIPDDSTPKCGSCRDLAAALIGILGKVTALKITPGNVSLSNLRPPNVSVFERVRSLELVGLPVHLIPELFQKLGQRLNSLVCQHNGIFCLRSFLSGNADLVQPWKELRYIDVAFNDLCDLDDSLSLLPNLKLFNISHNKLQNPAGVELLKEVECLNLSYNHLCSIPRFSAASCTTLKKLALKGNLIEDLNGLEYLAQLEELDLRWNILSNHALLLPMKELSHLAKLDLEGNPMTFHHQHRPLTATHLDGAAVTRGIRLDGVTLSASDVKKASNIILPMESSRQNIGLSLDSSLSITFGSSYGSGRSVTGKKKMRKMREVTIIDPDEVTVVPATLTVPQIGNEVEEHLRTKMIMEKKREKLGSGWLVSTSTPPNSYVPESQQQNPVPSESPIEIYGGETVSLNDDGAHSEDDVEVLEQTTPRSEDGSSMPLSPQVDLYETNPFTPDSAEEIPQYERFDDEEIEFDGDLILVKSSGKDLFISVAPDRLGELDAFTGKLLNTLDLRALVSARKLEAEQEQFAIKLVFDTRRKENQERTYELESEDALQAFLVLMKKVISEQPATLILQCLKCSAEFSEKLAEYTIVDTFTGKNNGTGGSLPTGEPKQVRTCPKCNSTMLVESNSNPSVPAKNTPSLQGGITELPVMMKPAKLDTASVKALGKSRLEEDLEHPPHGVERSESDITVLSNPSQSSIALVSEHGSSCWEGQELDYNKLMPVLSTCYEREDDSSDHTSGELARSGSFCGRGSSRSPIGRLDLETVSISSNRFTRMDHQIKLYLEMEVFSEHEEVMAVLESWIVIRSNAVEQRGLFLATDKKMYLFSYADPNINNPSGDDIWHHLHQEHCCSIKSLHQIYIFPGDQGFSVTYANGSKQFAVLTKEGSICKEFLDHLKEVLQLGRDLFSNDAIEEELCQVLRRTLREKDDRPIDEGWLLFFLLISWSNLEASGPVLQSAAIAVTQEDLFVLHIDYFAKKSLPPLSFTSIESQPISNLTSLHIGGESTIIGLHFLDEVFNREKCWLLQVQDKSSISDLLFALKDPWEAIFGINLKPTTVAKCSCGI